MKYFFTLLSLLFFIRLNSQELFPHNEPASNMPKGVLGVRQFNESFKEVNIYRNMFCLRLMYGLLPKLTVMATVGANNHHSKNFPPNLISHTHNGNQTTFTTGNFKRGIQYPYQVTGVYLFAKYRFFTRDGQNKHLRMALYGEWSNNKVAHDEAEPNLLDDTKGMGGGIIVTALKKRFAFSLNTGVVIPGSYTGFATDPNDSTLVSTKVNYGNAFIYNFSFGYLIYPKKYSNYKQTNFNIYLEFMGKAYRQAKITQYGFVDVPIQTPLLKAGNYMEIHPGVQAIFNSNLRLDLSVGFPLLNGSYARFYPIFMIGIQRYFYFKKS
jgi:hypothetical protein